jgi:hypothetical protein
MRIRGHHLICRLGFRGLGYDERFTRTMEEVLVSFELNPDLRLKVVKDLDILCTACPNRREDICYSEEDERQDKRIKEMDQFVISVLELEENGIYTLEEINNRIINYFMDGDMAELCQSCEWKDYDYCLKGLRELRKKKD